MRRRKKAEIKEDNATVAVTSTKIRKRSLILGTASLVIICLNIITIFTTYRGIIFLLPAPLILSLLSVIFGKKDGNETGLVYGSISLLLNIMAIAGMVFMYFLTLINK